MSGLLWELYRTAGGTEEEEEEETLDSCILSDGATFHPCGIVNNMHISTNITSTSHRPV